MGYEFTSRIRYSETDQDGLLTIPHLADYFQDCTVFHDASVGMGMDYWYEKGAMWVMTSVKILIFRRPKYGELVNTRTDAISCRRFQGLRNFKMRDESGKMLAAAFTKFALLSTENGQPIRIPEEDGLRYGTSEPLPIEEEKGKITLDGEITDGEPIEVMRHHLDPNHHVNNTQYMIFAMNLLPEGYEPEVMRISFHKSAKLGDVMYPKLTSDGHTISGMLTDTEGEPYAIFRFLDKCSEQDAKVAAL